MSLRWVAYLWSGSRWAFYLPAWQRRVAQWPVNWRYAVTEAATIACRSGWAGLGTGYARILPRRIATSPADPLYDFGLTVRRHLTKQKQNITISLNMQINHNNTLILWKFKPIKAASEIQVRRRGYGWGGIALQPTYCVHLTFIWPWYVADVYT